MAELFFFVCLFVFVFGELLFYSKSVLKKISCVKIRKCLVHIAYFNVIFGT